MKDIGKKGVLLLISAVLLCSVLLYLSFAWYTKMTSVGGMEFKAAKWDFSANYQVGDFLINVNSYEETTINPELAAPGTEGYTDVALRSENSDTAVSFVVSVDKSSMSKSFQDRFFFYYESNGTRTEFVPSGVYKSVVQGEIEPNGDETIRIYWRWAYDYDEVLSKKDADKAAVVKILKELKEQDREFFLMSPANTSAVLSGEAHFYNYAAMPAADRDTLNAYKASLGTSFISFRNIWLNYQDDPNYVEGSALYNVVQIISGLNSDSVGTSYLSDREVFLQFEERVLMGEELFVTGTPAAMKAESRNKLTAYQSKLNGASYKEFWEGYLAEEKEYNEFDTLVGSNTQLYESQMSATVTITGGQVMPQATGSN